MNPLAMILVAETSLHLAAEPCSTPMLTRFPREEHTPWPALSALEIAKASFGVDHTVPASSLKDATLLLLPVRSLSGTYKWLTCRSICERFLHDIFPEAAPDHLPWSMAAVTTSEAPRAHYLEERLTESALPAPESMLRCLRQAVSGHPIADRLASQIVILDEKDFGWFCAYALPKQGRTRLTHEKAIKQAWFEEVVPSDAIFYTLCNSEDDDLLALWRNRLHERPYLQLGHNRSIGQGWLWARCLTPASQTADFCKPA